MLDETHVVILDNASFHKGAETARLILFRARSKDAFGNLCDSCYRGTLIFFVRKHLRNSCELSVISCELKRC